MDRDRALGWLFSGVVAVCALYIFWDGLIPHPVRRKKFQPPVVHVKPVEMQVVAPMELPPPVPRQVEPGPKLPKLLPPPRPVQVGKGNSPNHRKT